MKHPSRVALLALGLFLGGLKPASAAPISLSFFGTIDLSTFGGLASNTFGGSFTWDTTAKPIGTYGTDTTIYGLSSATFSLNSIDLTSRITSPSFSVTNAKSGDSFSFGWQFVPALDAGVGVDISAFVGSLSLPASVFTSENVPANTSFLGSVTASVSQMGGYPPLTTTLGSLTVTKTIPNPEPASLMLLASGIAGAVVAGARRRSRGKRANS